MKFFNFSFDYFLLLDIFAAINYLKFIRIMKKIYAFIVVVAAAAMVSCAGNANKPAAAEVVEVAAEEVSACCGECADSVKADSCCKAAAAVEVVEAAK